MPEDLIIIIVLSIVILVVIGTVLYDNYFKSAPVPS